MYEVINLVKRDLKLYLRDKLSVFFSLLSSIILLIIYVLFLGNSVGGELKELLTNSELKFMVYSNMLAGILVLNTITIPLGVLGTVVTDMQNNQLDAFLVTPVKRYKVILGYYIASYLITLVLSIVIWLFAVILMGTVTGIYYDGATVLSVILLLPIFILISTSFMVLLTTFIPSVNAFGAVSGIFGSVIGFVSGIYIPLTSSAPKALNYISSLLPFTHMGTAFKQLLMQGSLELLADLTNNNQDLLAQVKDSFGMNVIGFLGMDVPLFYLILGSLVLAGGLFALSTIRLNKKMQR
ncbi:ABC transporter permease [Acholeplasma hippikon]|uniref:Transport permease protein n=1 Tax=Acholeplasma hippikon TaxID=264636 RepID=A0A449BL18_9MOLU|nr:ABC transporter permease [Acholeplasma hippikon]VEU83124.1 ABC transporter [Acholeplasma hippikon]